MCRTHENQWQVQYFRGGQKWGFLGFGTKIIKPKAIFCCIWPTHAIFWYFPRILMGPVSVTLLGTRKSTMSTFVYTPPTVTRPGFLKQTERRLGLRFRPEKPGFFTRSALGSIYSLFQKYRVFQKNDDFAKNTQIWSKFDWFWSGPRFCNRSRLGCDFINFQNFSGFLRVIFTRNCLGLKKHVFSEMPNLYLKNVPEKPWVFDDLNLSQFWVWLEKNTIF